MSRGSKQIAAAALAAVTAVFGVALAPRAADAQSARKADSYAAALATGGVAARAGMCPKTALRKGGESLSAGTVRLTLRSVARDCANLGAETILKIGLVGDYGVDGVAPAAVSAPLTITVLDPKGRTIATRAATIRIGIAKDRARSAFSYLEDNVSLPPDKRYDGWKVVVGFGEPASAPARVAAVR